MPAKDIYEAIRTAVPLKEYCENQCGISFKKIGTSFRSNSPFTQSKGAFAISVSMPELWYDFTADTSTGDVIELSALLNHDGNKREALLELIEYLPESEQEQYSQALMKLVNDKKLVQEKIVSCHEDLLSEKRAFVRAYLHSRGVDDEQIDRLKLGYDVNTFRLILPRYDFNGHEVRYYNTRRVPNKDGKENENDLRYQMAAIGDNTFLKNVPIGLQTLTRKSKYLVLTEGDFDFMCFEREGFAALGKFKEEFWPEVIAHAEAFEAVILAYDIDEPGQKYTKDASERLFSKAVPFKVVDMPKDKGYKDVDGFREAGGNVKELIDNAVDGLDFLTLSFIPPEDFDSMTRTQKKAKQKALKEFIFTAKRHGADDSDLLSLCEKLSSYYSVSWLGEVLKDAKKGETEYDTVEHMCEKYMFMYNTRTGFYRYNESRGIWENLDDLQVGSIVRTYLGRTATAKKIRSITEHLKAAVASNEPIEKLNRLQLFGFKNGTLHYTRKNEKEALFRPADATDFLTIRATYAYDKGASCPTWEKALFTIFGGDARRIACLQEFFGYCLLGHCKYQKALILRDKNENGSNGKSTLLSVFRAMLGEENTTSLEPYQFQDEYEIIRLKDAKANISTDANTETTMSMAGSETNLKKAITGDTLIGRRLFKDPIEFKNTAKVIFALNGNLKTKDKSGSMKRRFLLIDCTARFVEDEPQEGEVKADRNMTEKLMKELPGIFNWCVEGAKRLIKNEGKFTLTEEQNELNGVFKKPDKAESVEAFTEEVLPDMYDTDGNGKQVSYGEMFESYLAFCTENTVNEKERAEYQHFHTLFKKTLNEKNIQYIVKQTREERRVYDFLKIA